jgi:hypothetical protein
MYTKVSPEFAVAKKLFCVGVQFLGAEVARRLLIT